MQQKVSRSRRRETAMTPERISLAYRCSSQVTHCHVFFKKQHKRVGVGETTKNGWRVQINETRMRTTTVDQVRRGDIVGKHNQGPPLYGQCSFNICFSLSVSKNVSAYGYPWLSRSGPTSYSVRGVLKSHQSFTLALTVLLIFDIVFFPGSHYGPSCTKPF